jgi:hypothetical protein
VVQEVDAEVVVRALAKKGWSEKNFQVRATVVIRLQFSFFSLGVTVLPGFI